MSLSFCATDNGVGRNCVAWSGAFRHGRDGSGGLPEREGCSDRSQSEFCPRSRWARQANVAKLGHLRSSSILRQRGRGYVERCFAVLSRTCSIIDGDRTAQLSRYPSPARWSPTPPHATLVGCGAEPGCPRRTAFGAAIASPSAAGRCYARRSASVPLGIALATATGSAEPLGRVLDRVVPRSRTAGVDAEVEDPQADAMVAQVVGQRCEPCRDLPRRDSSVMRICRGDGSVTTRWCLLRQGLMQSDLNLSHPEAVTPAAVSSAAW